MKMKSDHGEVEPEHGKMALEQRKLKSIDNQMSDYSLLVKKKGKLSFSCNNKLDKTISDLPEELLAKILKRLPVKDILRCMCVQKSWYYLIHTPMFITLHGSYIKSNTHSHPKYLFFESIYTGSLTVRFDDKQCEQYCAIELFPAYSDTAWVAHSHGLVCVTSMFNIGPLRTDVYPNIYLWNPLVQKYKTLPDSPLPPYTMEDRMELNCWQTLAFGFVPEHNDYLVIRIVKPRSHSVPNPHALIISVYSLNSNSWKTMSHDDVFNCTIRCHSVFVNGAAFWMGFNSKKEPRLYSFDTKTNLLQEIYFPHWDEDFHVPDYIHLALHPFGQSVAYLVQDESRNHFNMWVLIDYQVNECIWEKKLRVKLNYEFPAKELHAEVVGLRNNGEPIFFSLFDLVSCNLRHEATDFVDSWDRWDDFSLYEEDFGPPFVVTPFVESLVLLDSDEKIEQTSKPVACTGSPVEFVDSGLSSYVTDMLFP